MDVNQPAPLQTITEAQVYEALKECFDPEIPVNVVDLGLVYDVKIIDDWVGVKMTLTTPGCGMGGQISTNIRERHFHADPIVDDFDVVDESEINHVHRDLGIKAF